MNKQTIKSDSSRLRQGVLLFGTLAFTLIFFLVALTYFFPAQTLNIFGKEVSAKVVLQVSGGLVWLAIVAGILKYYWIPRKSSTSKSH